MWAKFAGIKNKSKYVSAKCSFTDGRENAVLPYLCLKEVKNDMQKKALQSELVFGRHGWPGIIAVNVILRRPSFQSSKYSNK